MKRILLNTCVGLIAFGVGVLVSSSSILRQANDPFLPKQDISSIKILNLPSPGNALKEFIPSPPTTYKAERKTPFCTDKKIWPIWRVLKKDIEFRDRVGYSDESADCSDMLEIQNYDLNNDGIPERLVRGKNFQLCSAVGNCGFWIFGKNNGSWRILLSSSDYIDVTKNGDQVLRSKTNGYSNIVLKGHMDASNTDFEYFRFMSGRYGSYRCMVDAYVPGSNPKPKWKFITCGEYDRRQKIN